MPLFLEVVTCGYAESADNNNKKKKKRQTQGCKVEVYALKAKKHHYKCSHNNFNFDSPMCVCVHGNLFWLCFVFVMWLCAPIWKKSTLLLSPVNRLTSDDIRKQHPRALANQLETLTVSNSRLESELRSAEQERRQLQGALKEAKKSAASKQAQTEAAEKHKQDEEKEKEVLASLSVFEFTVVVFPSEHRLKL